MTEESLFELALNTPAADRAALLDRECASNLELRRRVEALLRADAQPGDLLKAQPLLDKTGSFAGARGASVLERPGVIIAGKYKLLQQIGEGGMGSVWMADQTEPVKRRVAVKLIRAERGSSSTILARFEAERQAIALMDHPHIARLLDAGTTDDGSPFFVMELVKGVPLTEFCDAHQLTILERLQLFQQICSAVQHAHQKGIIHRDLKPTNILIESHDNKPVPKVIDFGLAKATSGMQLTENTLFTALGTVAGTPLYMAPEQAKFNAIDVDTRADVYSLGVILYELLTGTTPIERETFKKAAFDEMLRTIREEEPPTPSKRLSSAESKPSVAANRRLEPAKLGGFVRGELDWIVMKALSKERERRYETANGFAKDIERFLNHEPVQAGPPSSAYRLRKFVRRNRPQVIAASLVLLALLAGMVGTTLGLFEAKRQEDIARSEAAEKELARQAEAEERKMADAAKADAQAKEAEANAVVAFFQNKVFAAARPKGQDGGLGKEVSLRDAIVASLPALGQGFAAQPLVEARLRLALGKTFFYLAEHEQARDQFEQSRALCTRHRGPDHPDTLSSMHNLASSYAALNRPAEALKLDEEVLEIRKRVLPKDHLDTLTSMSNLSTSYAALNRPAEALKLREEVLEILKRVLPKDHPETLAGMHNLANSYADLNRPGEALKLYEEVLAIQKRVLPKDHPDTLKSMGALAESLIKLDRGAEAIPLIDECVAKAAGQAVDPRLIPTVMALRMGHFQKVGDPAGCRATAAMWEKLNRPDAGSLYDAACFRAVTAGVQATAKTADAAKLAQDDADRAMQWLHKAVQAGYKDAAHMRKDTDLDPLREREDFKKLLAELEEAKKP